MLEGIKSSVFKTKQPLPNDEVHNLKDRLATVSAEAVSSAEEYTKTMKQFRRNDVIYQIGVFTGNVKRT